MSLNTIGSYMLQTKHAVATEGKIYIVKIT